MISLECVSKYFGEHHVLEDITLNVEQGEKIVIIGLSGLDKSALVRCMNQLEKVNDGSVVIDNIDITKPRAPVQKIRQKITIASQNFSLYVHKVIINNLTLAPIKVTGVSEDETARTGMEYLERVGLADKASVYLPQLPSGQQQRVTIVRALSMHPEIILFDEPISAPDPETIQEVLDVMVDLSKQNITVVCVIHGMGFARQVVDRVIFMDQGQVIRQETPEHFSISTENPRAKEFLSKTIHSG